MEKSEEVVVVVLNYNDYITTIKFITMIQNFKDRIQVVVVDNLSTDESFKELKKLENDKITVIQADKNGGYAYGNNYGIQYAIKQYQPEFLLISNPDIIFDESLITKMKNCYSEKQNVGQVACMMKSLQGKKEYVVWKQPTYWDCICEMSILLKKLLGKRTQYDPELFENEKMLPVDVLSGAFFMIKAKTMQEVQFFDSNTFLYGEENILAYKLKEKNYQNYLLTQEEYIHNHGQTIRKNVKSLLKLYEFLIDSLYRYTTEYLRVNTFKKILFKILSIVFRVEKVMYSIFRKNKEQE